jgi:acyl-CoA synthetase (AMP-forming)/AMP-acid ligase II
VIGAADELTGQAVYAFVTLKPEFKLDSATGAVGSGADSGYSSGSQSPGADGRKISGAGESVSPSSSSSSSTAVSPVAGVGHGQSIGVVGEGERLLIKELALHIRKVIGPFATPKRIVLVGDLPKTRSGKIMRRVLRKIVAGEADQLGDLSTLADPAVVVQIVAKVGLATAGAAK